MIGNTRFRVDHMPEEYAEMKSRLVKQLRVLEERPEKECTDLKMMLKAPIE